jgi:hypothetical protein
MVEQLFDHCYRLLTGDRAPMPSDGRAPVGEGFDPMTEYLPPPAPPAYLFPAHAPSGRSAAAAINAMGNAWQGMTSAATGSHYGTVATSGRPPTDYGFAGVHFHTKKEP